MNFNRIAGYYDQLDPMERLAAIEAAESRGDDAERQRLIRAAPRLAWTLPDYAGLSLAHLHLMQVGHAQLLTLAARFFWALSVMAGFRQAWQRHGDAPDVVADAEGFEKAHEAYEEVCWHAYSLIAQLDGLRLFEQETGLGTDAMRQYMPGYELVSDAERLARTCAFQDAPEAADWLRRRGDRDTAPPVAAGVAGMLRDYLPKYNRLLRPPKQ
jgi:hypothetical protein